MATGQRRRRHRTTNAGRPRTPAQRVLFYRHVKTLSMSAFRRTSSRPSPIKPRALGACLLGGLLAAGTTAHAEESSNARWVSDTLSTYVRSGPTDGYRIVGTLTSGQKVELLRTQGDYSQVRGDNGNSVWLPSSDLQQQPGQAERLPSLEQKVTELSTQLEGIDNSWKTRVQGMQETLDSRKKLIDELQAARNSLDSELNQARAESRDLQAQLGNERQQVLMRYMIYGGSIAGAGLLVGLVLPTMMRVRRKRSDGWV
ncbi:MAG: hypothetical protein GAK44_00101 [Pseudomonas delhiensis]|nr:MAG: hypothetical protein GAK44_00101 [Pseudomonas delhiensis]